MKNWLDKMERRFGRYAIRNLTMYLLAGYAIGYLLSFTMPQLLTYFTLEPALILNCLLYTSGFRGGRTGIDSKVGITAVAGKITNRHLMLCMAVLKFIVICFAGKERLHTLNFKVHFNMGIQLFLHLTKRGDYILFRVQRRADGCKKMGILWCDNVFVIQLESCLLYTSLHIFMEFWNLQRDRGWTKYMFTASLTDVIHLQHLGKNMLNSQKQR